MKIAKRQQFLRNIETVYEKTGKIAETSYIDSDSYTNVISDSAIHDRIGADQL